MSKDAPTVSLIGAGKMGLPLACAFADRGATVIACDKSQKVVDLINAGKCHFEEPGLDEMLAAQVKAGRLRATTDTTTAVSQSSVVVVIVPVLLTAGCEADTSIIRAVSEDIARGLKPGTMVSYETTLPVGGTRSFIPILEKSGLKAGKDFDLVFSPERVKSQLVLSRLRENPKVVGGITSEAAKRAEEFYAMYLGAPVMNVGTLEASELVKLAGMVYRDVNIALSNELSRYAETLGIDILPVIEAANTDGEAALLSPGIGVGGHCTPVYPHFLINDARRKNVPLPIAENGRLVNDEQPSHVIDTIERYWQPVVGKQVCILGLGFRPEVKESLYSPAFALRDELKSRGAIVTLHDPLYSAEEIKSEGFEPTDIAAKKLPEILILNTAHGAYKALDFADLKSRGAKLIVDGRNAFKPEQVKKTGLEYFGIGRRAIETANNGNKPTQESPMIPITKPELGLPEIRGATRVINSGWIMQGPEVARFEKEFADYVSAPHACAVSSGTAALHLALLAIDVGPGDEVTTVSHSFIATANSIRFCGATPVFVDIEAETFNIDPKLVERAITPKTKAILCVHQMGLPCDLKQLRAIADKHKLILIEDAACAIGSEVKLNGNWEKIGKPHSHMACFSFHPRKLLTTGDGGMITSAERELDVKLKLLRNHGMDTSTPGQQSFPIVGFNYRMTDIQAAIGREQLIRIDTMVDKRRALVERYRTLFEGSEMVFPHEPDWAKTNWQSLCLRLPRAVAQSNVIAALANVGVSTRPGIMCAHREPAYANEKLPHPLPVSETCQDTSIIIPLYPDMTVEEQTRVATEFKQVLKKAKIGAS